MISAVFNIPEGKFTIQGHSGSAESGQDIICAAVSSAAYMAVNTITEILGQKVSADVRDGYMKISLSGNNEAASDILRGLELHISELADEYPDFIRITTEV
ncbi:MAG: ribosomal-processing cysteine protease Prp [Clostridia bacterium]|nr:ribosomal-processing cysteine protease Prp [Clostridia bacterium]